MLGRYWGEAVLAVLGEAVLGRQYGGGMGVIGGYWGGIGWGNGGGDIWGG